VTRILHIAGSIFIIAVTLSFAAFTVIWIVLQ
jgi:hypothetical protein